MGRQTNGTMIGSMYGSMTDVNIWDTYFTQENVNDFHSCKELSYGKLLDWRTSKINVKGYVLEEERMEMICKKTNQVDKIVIGNLKGKTKDEMIFFCYQAYNGRINILNYQNLDSTIKEAKFLGMESSFFTGHIRDQSRSHEYHFIDIYDNSSLENF